MKIAKGVVLVPKLNLGTQMSPRLCLGPFPCQTMLGDITNDLKPDCSLKVAQAFQPVRMQDRACGYI